MSAEGNPLDSLGSYLTHTSWNVAAFSERFGAPTSGRCILTGRRFKKGAVVREITLASGERGLGLSGVFGIGTIDGKEWFSHLCFDLAKLPGFVVRPELRLIVLYNALGDPAHYVPQGDGTWLNGNQVFTARRFAKRAGQASAFLAA